jgi:DNA-binding response OmpR family regulator
MLRHPACKSGISMSKGFEFMDDTPPPSRGIILLVEDEPLIRMSVVDFLAEQGYTIEEAGTAKTALQRIHILGGQIDAVVLDLGLPDRPGDVLANEIRTAYPAVPIIIASGQSVTEMRRRFDTRDGMAFLTKPYEFEDLTNTIELLRRIRI